MENYCWCFLFNVYKRFLSRFLFLGKRFFIYASNKYLNQKSPHSRLHGPIWVTCSFQFSSAFSPCCQNWFSQFHFHFPLTTYDLRNWHRTDGGTGWRETWDASFRPAACQPLASNWKSAAWNHVPRPTQAHLRKQQLKSTPKCILSRCWKQERPHSKLHQPLQHLFFPAATKNFDPQPWSSNLTYTVSR